MNRIPSNLIRSSQRAQNQFLRLAACGVMLALSLLLTGCGGSSDSTTNPVPIITSISPNQATAGDSGFTLTVSGDDFVAGAIVRWNGLSRTTTRVSDEQLTATILASDVASSGTVSVTVYNPAPGGGASNAATFTIAAGPLAIDTGTLPDAAPSRTYGYTLQASGGVSPYTWSVTSGTLPSGLTLTSSSGLLTGIPPTLSNDTPYPFTLRVTDAAATTATRDLTLMVRSTSQTRNDSCSAATAIKNGVVRASLSPYGDVDVYSFQGTAGQKVTIEIVAQRLDIYGDGTDDRDIYLDSFVELLSPSCAQLTYSDDIDSGVTQDSLIESYTLPGTTGTTYTYYIRVSDLRGDGRPDFIYDLYLSGANN